MENPNNAQPKSTFLIEKIYLKDLSFESPHTPEIFKSENWKPHVDLNVNSHSKFLENDLYEVVLTLNVKTTNEEQNVYLVEVHYAGVYTLQGFEKEQLNEILGSFCPNLLYPYVSQTISDLVTKSGFPPLNLAPLNFDAIYKDTLARKQKDSAPA